MGSNKYKVKCKNCDTKVNKYNKTGLCSKCNTQKRKEKLTEKWLENGNISLKGRPRGYIREYIQKQQDNKCILCGQENTWNGKPLIFILDHIDGDSRNNSPDNLRMICPNCDTQLPTFKSKNKGNGRKYAREYRIKKYREEWPSGLRHDS
jgi:Zn finger protein HypA/HybF involved in hydrogenase expression